MIHIYKCSIYIAEDNSPGLMKMRFIRPKEIEMANSRLSGSINYRTKVVLIIKGNYCVSVCKPAALLECFQHTVSV